MAGTEKAISWRDELAAELAIRLPSLAQTKAFSTDGAPNLLVGAGTAGSDSCFAKIGTIASLAKDVLGLAQNVYANHVAQLVFEANPAGGAGADVQTWTTRMAVIGALVAKGVRVEVYESANGTGPSEAGITGAPKASFEIHPQYPQMGSM